MDTNKSLIDRIVNGDNGAQELLYKMFSAQMYTVCLRYINDKEDANDAFQNGFLKIFDKIKDLRNPDALPGWIKSIFVNECINFYKKWQKINSIYVNHKAEGIDNLPSNYSSIIDKLSAKEIIKHINNLPPQYKLVFNLYVFEDLKHKEIAKKLEISVGTSKSNLHDARRILSEKVTKMKEYKGLKLNINKGQV